MTVAQLSIPHSKTALVDRREQHKTVGSAPRHELEWLAEHGDLLRFRAADVVVVKQVPVVEMIIMLTGTLAHYVDRGAGRRKVMEWHGGDVTGLLPYSRLNIAPGESVIDEDTDGVVLHRDCFLELTRECPNVTAMLVHAMLDRTRQFTSTDWQDEKIMSLGRLAAGLAHELNNPASAVARSARRARSALADRERCAT